MKIIIVGAGEVGFHAAQRLSSENQDVVLIDKDPEKIKRITENLDIQAILGSGTSPETLKISGVREADMLVAATDSDEANLIACLLARNMNKRTYSERISWVLIRLLTRSRPWSKRSLIS